MHCLYLFIIMCVCAVHPSRGNRRQAMGQGSASGLGESATASSAGRPAPSRTDPAKLVPHTAAPAPTVSLRCEGGGRGRNGRAYASNAYTFRQAGNAEASQAPHHPNPHSSVTAALGAPKHARPGWQSPRVALRGAGSHTPRGPHACMEVHMRGQWWCRHRSQASRQPQAELREAQGTAQGTPHHTIRGHPKPSGGACREGSRRGPTVPQATMGGEAAEGRKGQRNYG